MGGGVITGWRIRRIVLEQSRRAGVGHIGCSLSIADLLAALYGRCLRLDPVATNERDRFILSKGQAALALYAALALARLIPESELDTYCADGTRLGVHPERGLPGVDFSTGSLGMGLPFGAGAALAGRLQGSERRVFVLVSDAECNEGALWEAAMFAAHHRLGRLVAIVDANGQQAFGYTKDVLCLEPLGERWEAFGWDVRQVDGHDAGAIAETINSLDYNGGSPHVLIARTTFGKGVSFMENQIRWHYLPMSDQQYGLALAELGDEP